MARAEVANVAQRILPRGTRPDQDLIDKIEEAIEKTKVDLDENASYAEEMDAKLKNENDAVELLEGSPKPKAKVKPKK